MAQRLNYAAISPAGMKSLGGVHAYITQSGLPKPLVDLVYLRASLINGCAYCIDLMNAFNRMAISFRATLAALK